MRRYDAATLTPVAAGVASYVLVLAAIVHGSAHVGGWDSHAAAGRYVPFVLVTLGAAVFLAVRVTGFRRMM